MIASYVKNAIATVRKNMNTKYLSAVIVSHVVNAYKEADNDEDMMRSVTAEVNEILQNNVVEPAQALAKLGMLTAKSVESMVLIPTSNGNTIIPLSQIAHMHDTVDLNNKPMCSIHLKDGGRISSSAPAEFLMDLMREAGMMIYSDSKISLAKA